MKTEINIFKTIWVGTSMGILILMGCSHDEHTYDGSGSFESTEIVISSEATGIIKEFQVEEGQQLSKKEKVGIIDTTLLHLQRAQIKAQIISVQQGIPDIEAQTSYFDQQIELARIKLLHLKQEQTRIQNLVQGESATQKQLDDINTQVAQARQQIHVLQNQKDSQVSALSTRKAGIQARPLPFQAQLKEIDEKIRRSQIINPRAGTVLTTYAEAGEFTAPGKPLYRIADLSEIYLKAYISGNQYSNIRLHQNISVYTDDGNGGYHQNTGTISWISDKAEFTPKTIRTKEERENLVYAIKVAVPNDKDWYKIGMYGEVKF